MEEIVHRKIESANDILLDPAQADQSQLKLFIVVMLVLPFDTYSLTMSSAVGNTDGLMGII